MQIPSRTLHYVGSGLALTALCGAAVTKKPALLLAVPIAGELLTDLNDYYCFQLPQPALHVRCLMLAMRPAPECGVGSTADAKIIQRPFALLRQQLCRLWSGMGCPLQGGEEQAHDLQVSIQVDYTAMHHHAP